MARLIVLAIIALPTSCKRDGDRTPQTTASSTTSVADAARESLTDEGNKPKAVQAPGADSDAETVTPEKPANKTDLKIPEQWQEITSYDGFAIDIKYATSDNFTKKKIYDCGRCFLRPEAAEALEAIQDELQKKHGYSIKVFDCFRPRPYQQRLWDAVPDPDYVTPPAKGSMHSRGLAVDLTIVDGNGKDLDMGTPYDFFGEEAHQDYKKLKPEVASNRQLLKTTMEKHGFNSIRTEWWHYSYGKKSYPLDNWVWPCKL